MKALQFKIKHETRLKLQNIIQSEEWRKIEQKNIKIKIPLFKFALDVVIYSVCLKFRYCERSQAEAAKIRPVQRV